MSQEETHLTSSKSSHFTPQCLSPLLYIFLDSIKLIFIQFPSFFFLIYLILALPLSLFLTIHYLLATPRGLKSNIVRLEWLVQVVDNWVEAGNIRETSQLDIGRLHRFKAVTVLPVFLLSLLLAVAVVRVTTSPREKRSSADWKRPVVTCLTTGLFWIIWGHLTPLAITAGGHISYQTAVIAQLATVPVEIYFMAVFSLALIVSIAEEKSGFEAVRVGSGLMKGRRVTGWVLSGLILVGVNYIGKEIVGVIDGQDLIRGYKWTVEMKVGYMIGLEILLGWVILWSYVMVTIFYRECRKRHVIRQDNVELVDCHGES